MDAVKQTEAPCPKCGALGPHAATACESGVHYAKAKCSACRASWFVSKPNNDRTKYRRPAGHRNLVEAYSNGYCEMCLREISDLPKGTTLEAQHVKEYQDGGGNERENIWIICTACHRLIHWVRTYHSSMVLHNQATDAMTKPGGDMIAGVVNPVGVLQEDGKWAWDAK